MTPDTDSLTLILDTFLDAFSLGRTAVGRSANSLLAILATLEILMAAIWWTITGSDVVVKFLKKVILIGFFIWIVESWDSLVGSVIAGFIYTGETAGATAGGNIVSLENPSAIVDAGFNAVLPIFEHLRSFDSYFSAVSNPIDLIIALLASVLIIGSFFVLAIQVFITRLEFGLMATLGLILIPFGVYRHTAFLSEKVFGALISFGIKLMILSFIISITFPILIQFKVPADPSWIEMLNMVLVSMSVMILSWHAPSVATGLLSGSPNLSARDVSGASMTASHALSQIVKQSGSIGSSTKGATAVASSATVSSVSTVGKVASFGAGMAVGAYNSPGSTIKNFGERAFSVGKEVLSSSFSTEGKTSKNSLRESFNSGREVRVSKGKMQGENLREAENTSPKVKEGTQNEQAVKSLKSKSTNTRSK